jgi:hypothetical protein
MNVMFNTKTEIKVGDVTPSLAISRNNTTNFPVSCGQKMKESVEAAPRLQMSHH